MFNPFQWLGGQIEYGAGKAINSVGSAIGNPLPETGLSERLMHNGSNLINNTDDSQAFQINAPYGTKPTAEQQAIIKAIPELSDPKQAAVIMANVSPAQLSQIAQQRAAGSAQTGGAPAPKATSPSSAGGGSGTAAADTTPDYKFIPGDPNPYDVTDKGQRLAYYQKLASQGDAFAQSQIAKTEAEFKKALEDSAYYQKEEGDKLDKNAIDLTADFNGGTEKLGTDYRIGSAQRQNTFSAMSPNAFQSSQADEQGATDTTYDKTQNKLLDTFNTKKGEISTKKGDLIKQYNDYITETNTKLADNRKSITDKVAGYKEGTIADLAPLDAADGVTNFKDRYNGPAYDPNAAAEALDISKYTPAVSFSAIPGQTGATNTNPFANIGTKVDPIQDYLDYTSVNKKKDPEKAYLGA